MSNIILRDNGTEFFNLQTHSTLTITGAVGVSNSSLVHTIDIPRIPAGATPFALIAPESSAGWSNIVVGTFSPQRYSPQISVASPTQIRVTFAFLNSSMTVVANLLLGYYY